MTAYNRVLGRCTIVEELRRIRVKDLAPSSEGDIGRVSRKPGDLDLRVQLPEILCNGQVLEDMAKTDGATHV